MRSAAASTSPTSPSSRRSTRPTAASSATRRRPARRSASRRSRWALRSRSTPSLRSPTEADIAAALPAVERVARRTPVLSTRTISERAGGKVLLKAENLQRTGSFKVRGAAAKLAALGEEGCAHGVVAASAGNHAQGLAAAAAALGVPCEVFVPADAPIAKAEAARGQGAVVHVGGASLDECLAAAHERE